jgi:hypothetical protein
MRRQLALTAASCGLLVSVLFAGGQTLTQRDADSLEQKLAVIVERGAAAAPSSRALRTQLTEREVNAYFKYQGAAELPVGVVNPNLAILDKSRVTASVVVDLDAVRLSRERAWSDPLAWVSGKLEVRVVCRIEAANGTGKLDLETATLGGVSIPMTLLQELVTYYSRTPESPSGFNLNQPFELPQRIRQVELQRGSAVIVQ